MPELPEVETVRRDVLPFVRGRTIKGVEITDPRNIKGISTRQFKKKIAGQKIKTVERSAKYLLFKLASGSYLVVHLGMTGRLLFAPDPYVKLAFNLSGKRKLYFSDARLFGKIRFYDGYPPLDLGPEPLTKEFTWKKLKEMLSKKKTLIKPLLMDQRFLGGVGNIYANEALFRSGIHPQRQANTLKEAEIKKLHKQIQKILLEALGCRGTSDNWFVDAKGKKGSFQLRLKVYRRKGEPCFKCRTPIERNRLGQRGTYFCSKCQK